MCRYHYSHFEDEGSETQDLDLDLSDFEALATTLVCHVVFPHMNIVTFKDAGWRQHLEQNGQAVRLGFQ